MKVLFIANGIAGDEPGLSGGETRFIEIAKVWAKAGYEIHLLSLNSGQKLCNYLGLNVTLHCFSKSRSTSRWQFLLQALRAFFFLPPSLKNFEGVVYSTNELIFDVLPALRMKLAGKNKIKWATVVHWLPPFPPWKRREATLLNSTLFFLNERLSILLANRFADVLLAVSKLTRDQLKAWGATLNKVHAVECGVNFADIRAMTSNTPSPVYDAVFMKRLQAVKGIFDIIDIWQQVLQIKPDAKLLIIGEGIDGERARTIVQERGLANNIQFSGVIYDYQEKFARLAQSKLFVLPTYEENWAIVIGEAMAAGVPVIAYHLTELADVWGASLLTVPVGDKQAFAAKILELLGNHAAWSAYQQQGLMTASKYDWEKIARQELDLVVGEHQQQDKALCV